MGVRVLSLGWVKTLRRISLVFFFLIAFVTFYFSHYTRLKRLKEVNRKLVLQIDKLQKEIDNLQKETKKLGKDSYLYEKLARDTIGVAREDEIVVDIKE